MILVYAQNIFNKYKTHWLWMSAQFHVRALVECQYEFIYIFSAARDHRPTCMRTLRRRWNSYITISSEYPNRELHSNFQCHVKRVALLSFYEQIASDYVCVLTYLIWSVENHLNLFQQVCRCGHIYDALLVHGVCVWVSELLASFWLINSHTRFVSSIWNRKTGKRKSLNE